jgi:hypothetical protein
MIEDKKEYLLNNFNKGVLSCPNWDKLAKHCIEQEIRAKLDVLDTPYVHLPTVIENLYAQLSQLKESVK